jgi:glycogen debranching enzyme
VVAKHDSLFLLSDDVGDILPGSDEGLYFHDMRHLSAHTLRLNGSAPVSLLADASDGDHVVFELSNLDLRDESGTVQVPKESLAIRRERSLDDDWSEKITVCNFGRSTADLSIELQYAADFADMFVIRGLHPGKRGTLQKPAWNGAELVFRYDGADGHSRTTNLHFSRPPDQHTKGELAYEVTLEPRQSWTLTVKCEIRDESGRRLEAQPGHKRDNAVQVRVEIETSHQLLNGVIQRSMQDLRMLSMRQGGDLFFAAGVPWYVALFGRDSLITSLEVAAFEPEICANTLRVLAAHQGTKVDDWRDEQPGKILHELRVDELANLDEVPQTPYYGSVDSTPLFLVLLGVYSSWVGSLDLFHHLRENVCAALDWIEGYGDSDGDGFIDYAPRSASGSRNQGWKDAANGIVLEDGHLAETPIALPEVQGDVYFAWQMMGDLFERDGETDYAEQLRSRARQLRRSFNEQFWIQSLNYYAFCRQKDGRFSKSVASNPAHALWTGIVDESHSRTVVDRVLQPDMFSGWGVRTLSSDDASYNPIEYQLGSIWPHDNAMIVAGMQRYGLSESATRVFSAIVHAATQFDQFRLPELFAGYDRGVASRPVQYPVACNPQAWAAGSVPFMLTSLLGLQPDAFNHQLHIRHPVLPEWLEWVNVRKLRVAEAEVDLRYERKRDGVKVTTLRTDGDLRVLVDN